MVNLSTLLRINFPCRGLVYHSKVQKFLPRIDLEKKVRGVDEAVISDFRKQLVDMYKNKTVEERNLSSIYQTYIALGNLMTVCALEKIDACPLEGFVPSKVDDLLNLKELNLSSVLLLPVGYRAENDIMSTMKKVRKPLSKTVIEIS